MSRPITPRQSERRSVVLPATCRTQTGMRDSAEIFDISPHGCRLRTSALTMREGMRIVIRPQGLEGMTAVVRWVEGQVAGLEFDSPLYEPVVDHLSRLHSAGKTVSVSSY